MNPFNFKITEDGDIDVVTEPGVEYLLTLKGVFDGATVAITTRSDLDSSFDTVEDASWTAETEKLFLAPSELTRFTTSSADTDTVIRVVLFPRQAKH